ncbi:MAG: hypothetical protein F6K31_40350 [Symploca sp. SIO2G7]|nr:hypothetical protein [Symploca sp. SIO2G7]
MGFAARADRDRENSVGDSRPQNLVFLHPVRPSARQVASGTFPSPEMSASGRATVFAPAEVKQLSRARRLPLGLKLLVGIQQGSTVLTGGLVAAALVIYSWTVYLDKTVAHAFQHLEALKVSTQQVTTANETLKHSMAEQAESPAAGFEPFEPKRAIFLPQAPVRPLVETSIDSSTEVSMPHPLGY